MPGLGQIVQGRIVKGLLFFVCLNFLFFFGQYLGSWRIVYIPENPPAPMGGQESHNKVLETLSRRAPFFAQFWIGVAAWPAIIQHYADNPLEKEHPWLGTYQRRPSEQELNNLIRNSDKGPDLGWVYTMIAGVLNLLVIYDALAGPAITMASSKQSAHEKQTAWA